jgi:hypothetical protein
MWLNLPRQRPHRQHHLFTSIYLFSSTIIPFILSFSPISFQPSLVDLSKFHSQEKFQYHFNVRSAIMAVKPSFSVPTIDISPYLRSPSSPEGLKVISSVREACTGTGFFQLVGHGIEPELQQRLFKGAEKLFKLPMEEKVKLDMSHSVGASNRGYELIGGQGLQEGTLPDLKEVRIFCLVLFLWFFLGGGQREGMISEWGWRRVEFPFSLYSVLEARELEWDWDLQDEG